MLTWLHENLGTIVISLILLVILAAIVRSMINDRKNGKSSCGCGCANCAMRGECHKK